MSKRTSVIPIAGVLASFILACSAAVLAAGPGGGGTAPDYGDLVVLYRDADGVPILTPATQVIDPETGLLVDGGLCLQPTAAEGDIFTILDETGAPIPCRTTPDGVCMVPVDPLTCAVPVDYAGHTQEIEFERINVARAPDDVMAQQLEDVLIGLATADCIQLDPAGRLLYQTLDVNDSDGDGDSEEYLAKTVDSPLQNLAIYKEMILKGQLGDPAIELPKPWNRYGFLDTAAKGLGAAASKEGSVDVDLVVYMNQIMGLSDEATTTLLDPKICIDYRAEVQGQMQLVHKCFLDYSSYGYLRNKTYGLLPYPAYIPEEEPKAGLFEYLAFYRNTVSGLEPLFWIVDGRILFAVFPDTSTADTKDYLPGFTGGNIGGIAQAADDARAVILFAHSNPIPEGWETPPLACTGEHQITYDVSIDATSGLAVPVNMVVNEDGREGTVVVANSGPDMASGSVTVQGVLNGTILGPFEFNFTDLAAGATQSSVFVIVAETAGTINWTATVTAPDDAYSPNNTVTGVTEVMAQ